MSTVVSVGSGPCSLSLTNVRAHPHGVDHEVVVVEGLVVTVATQEAPFILDVISVSAAVNIFVDDVLIILNAEGVLPFFKVLSGAVSIGDVTTLVEAGIVLREVNEAVRVAVNAVKVLEGFSRVELAPETLHLVVPVVGGVELSIKISVSLGHPGARLNEVAV